MLQEIGGPNWETVQLVQFDKQSSQTILGNSPVGPFWETVKWSKLGNSPNIQFEKQSRYPFGKQSNGQNWECPVVVKTKQSSLSKLETVQPVCQNWETVKSVHRGNSPVCQNWETVQSVQIGKQSSRSNGKHRTKLKQSAFVQFGKHSSGSNLKQSSRSNLGNSQVGPIWETVKSIQIGKQSSRFKLGNSRSD
ncbi:hypothetical protein AVEN_232544-1 [Araneus ventricosus]|uniref:Uncharacterized protein n=1 Tax=Araneus ventricosus TaxID=182803 RepID=A0A4Y1ZW20_ARAVE|nr:hypothetical protein AVEN_232544-1 [Araneus ventricosus]